MSGSGINLVSWKNGNKLDWGGSHIWDLFWNRFNIRVLPYHFRLGCWCSVKCIDFSSCAKDLTRVLVYYLTWLWVISDGASKRFGSIIFEDLVYCSCFNITNCFSYCEPATIIYEVCYVYNNSFIVYPYCIYSANICVPSRFFWYETTINFKRWPLPWCLFVRHS